MMTKIEFCISMEGSATFSKMGDLYEESSGSPPGRREVSISEAWRRVFVSCGICMMQKKFMKLC